MSAFVIADNIISPLGFTSRENFERLCNMESGVRKLAGSELSLEPVCAAVIDNQKIEAEFGKLKTEQEFTRLEKLVILSVNDALSQTQIDITSPETIIIFSSTKGNIDQLDPKNKAAQKRLLLWETADEIAQHFGNPNRPLVVSNACISGVLAILLGKRLLEGSQYKNAVVIGVDILTRFVVSGFQSFKAVSPEICKPYDAKRDGISLGEACGTVILSNEPEFAADGSILVKGGASSNDANHISGPSRNGEGLFLAITKALSDAGVKSSEVDHISGHGTATVFNDEMESIAISDAGLADVPMNSLKSYFGHTLGAAGVIESVIGIHSLRSGRMIGTFNYAEPGVSKKINIISSTTDGRIRNFLKTAAGFGGCNAAIFYERS